MGIDTVAPREEIGGAQLRWPQAHQLGETGSGTAIEVGDALGSDDRNAAQTLDPHRTSIQACVSDALVLVSSQIVDVSQNAINGDGGGIGANIAEPPVVSCAEPCRLLKT